MKNKLNFSKPQKDITAWLADKQSVNDELAEIRQAERKAKQELKLERQKWSFNYKLA